MNLEDVLKTAVNYNLRQGFHKCDAYKNARQKVIEACNELSKPSPDDIQLDLVLQRVISLLSSSISIKESLEVSESLGNSMIHFESKAEPGT